MYAKRFERCREVLRSLMPVDGFGRETWFSCKGEGEEHLDGRGEALVESNDTQHSVAFAQIAV